MVKKRIKVLEDNAFFEKEKDGGCSVWAPSLPGCTSQGDSFEEALTNIKEAIGLYLKDAEKGVFEEGRGVKNRFMVPVRVRLGYA